MPSNRRHLHTDEADFDGLIGSQQLQLLAPSQTGHMFQHQVGPSIQHRVVRGENKLIVSAPVIDVRCVLERGKLPPHVRDDDEFGVLQTVYVNTCNAWYVHIPGATQHATSIHEMEHEARVRAKRRTTTRPRSSSLSAATVPTPRQHRTAIPYRAYHFRIRGLPANDRGHQHPYFYGHEANFHNDATRQALLGVGPLSNTVGASDSDKPQHPFPLRTPIQSDGGFGIIDAYEYDFQACWWVVAMRAGIVIEYFYHLEWRFHDVGSVVRDGLEITRIDRTGGTTVLGRGPGKGSRNPVIGGTAADQLPTVTEWSRPFDDPMGLC